MRPILKKSLYIIIPFLVFIIPFLLGVTLVILPFKFIIYSFSTAETLGMAITGNSYENFLNNIIGKTKNIDKLKKSCALCYYNPSKAINEMDNYSWCVPNILTPFVGTGPEPGKHANAYINSRQFRSDEEISVSKPRNVFRILITGGSAAYGSGAPSQDSIIGNYLNKILNSELSFSTKTKYEVYTLANPAWTSTHEMIIIETRLSKLNPNMVISFSGINDVHWGLSGNNIYCFRSYADEHYWSIIQTIYKLAGYGSQHDIIKIGSSPIPPDVVASNLVRNVQLASFALSFNQARYVFILQPTLYVTSKALSLHEKEIKNIQYEEYFSECYQEIKQRLSNLKISNMTFIDESDAFKGLTSNDFIFIDSYHYGDRGTEFIAKKLFKDMRNIILQEQ
jgi:hypothetical protein